MAKLPPQREHTIPNQPTGFSILIMARDKANFVNFCSGETLTNGLQVKAGSCNGIGKSSTRPFATNIGADCRPQSYGKDPLDL